VSGIVSAATQAQLKGKQLYSKNARCRAKPDPTNTWNIINDGPMKVVMRLNAIPLAAKRLAV
jgi:hypothetical protein